MMSVRGLIAAADLSITTRISAVLAGYIEGNFIITDRDNVELNPRGMIEVIVPDFRRILLNSGVALRGGGTFAFGGLATIDGTFQVTSDSQYPRQMTEFTFIEIQRHRRPPIRVFPPF